MMWSFVKRFPLSSYQPKEYNGTIFPMNIGHAGKPSGRKTYIDVVMNGLNTPAFLAEIEPLYSTTRPFFYYTGQHNRNIRYFFARELDSKNIEWKTYSKDYAVEEYANGNESQHEELVRAHRHSYAAQLAIYNMANDREDSVDENGNIVTYKISETETKQLDYGGKITKVKETPHLTFDPLYKLTNYIIKDLSPIPIIKEGKTSQDKGFKLFADDEVLYFLSGAFSIPFNKLMGQMYFTNQATHQGYVINIKNVSINIYNGAYYIDFKTNKDAFKHISNILTYKKGEFANPKVHPPEIETMSVDGKVFYSKTFFAPSILEKTIDFDEEIEEFTIHNRLTIIAHTQANFNLYPKKDESSRENFRKKIYETIKRKKDLYKEKHSIESKVEKELTKKDEIEKTKEWIEHNTQKPENEGVKKTKLEDEEKEKKDRESLNSIVCSFASSGVYYEIKNNEYVFSSDPAYDVIRWILPAYQKAIIDSIPARIERYKNYYHEEGVYYSSQNRISKPINMPKGILDGILSHYCSELKKEQTPQEAKAKVEKYIEDVGKVASDYPGNFWGVIRVGWEWGNGKRIYSAENTDFPAQGYPTEQQLENGETVKVPVPKKVHFKTMMIADTVDVKIIFGEPVFKDIPKEKMKRIYLYDNRIYCTIESENSVILHNIWAMSNNFFLGVQLSPKKESFYAGSLGENEDLLSNFLLIDYNYNLKDGQRCEINKTNKRDVYIVCGFAQCRNASINKKVLPDSNRINW